MIILTQKSTPHLGRYENLPIILNKLNLLKLLFEGGECVIRTKGMPVCVTL